MFDKPPFAPVAAAVIGLCVVIAITIAPVEAWWTRIDPLGSSFAQLQNVPDFYLGLSDDGGRPLMSTIAWRRIADAPQADSIFGQLLRRGSPSARLYAALGLLHRNPNRLPALAAAFRTDSAILILAVACRRGEQVPLYRVLTLPDLHIWLRFLTSANADSMAKMVECAA